MLDLPAELDDDDDDDDDDDASSVTSETSSGSGSQANLATQPRTLSSVLNRLSNILDRRSQVCTALSYNGTMDLPGGLSGRGALPYLKVKGIFRPIDSHFLAHFDPVGSLFQASLKHAT